MSAKSYYKIWAVRRALALVMAVFICFSGLAPTMANALAFAVGNGADPLGDPESPGTPADPPALTLTYVLQERDATTNTVTALLTAQNMQNGVLDIVDDAAGQSVLAQPGDTDATVIITQNGTYSYTVTDGENNTANCSFTVSSILLPAPPTPAIALAGSMQNGYYKGEATATITCDDADPELMTALWYELDGQPRQPYAAPLVIQGDGMHSLVAIAINKDGVESESAPVHFEVEADWPRFAMDGESFSVYQGDSTDIEFELQHMPSATITARCDDATVLPDSALLVTAGSGDAQTLHIDIPASATPGTYSITLEADDNTQTITQTLTLTILETQAPVADITDVFRMRYDDEFTYDLADDCSDPGGRPLTYSLLSQPVNGRAVINDSILTYTPDGAASSETITLRVSNGVKHADAIITIHVYETPLLPDAPHSLTLQEDTSTSLDLSTLCSDPRNHELKYAIDSNPLKGRAEINGSILTYVPSSNYFGTDDLSITVSHKDSNLYAETLRVEITVTPVDDAPQAVDDGTVNVNSNSSVLIDVLANDITIDGGALEIRAIESQPTKGSCSIEGTKIRYTPDPRKSGSDTFRYSVIHEGKTLFDEAEVTVDIIKVNDKQSVALVQDMITISEDTLLSFEFDVIDKDSTDFESDFQIALTSNNTAVFAADAFTITSVQTNDDMRHYTVTAMPLQYANTTEHGSATITLSVTDRNDTSLVATATQQVTVTPVNNAPVISGHPDTAVEINEDGSYTLTFTVTDPDITNPEDGFTVSLASSDQSVLNAAGFVRQSAVRNDARTVTYTYKLSPLKDMFSESGVTVTITALDDGTGSDQLSDSVDFTLVIHAVNDPPVLTGLQAAYSMTEDTPELITFRVKDVDNVFAAGNFTVTHDDTDADYIANALVQSVVPGANDDEYIQ